jgi:LacI family transcriptional regulator
MRQRGRGDGSIRATITQVAAVAGVSTATASRALNRPAAVSDALRDRVGAAVAQLRYLPNQTARALSSLHSGLVGVLVPAIDSGYAQILQAIQDRLHQTGYSMLIEATGGDDHRAVDAAAAMAGREVEGLLVVGVDPKQALTGLLDGRHIPYVMVDAGGDVPPEISVGVGYAGGGETVGRYLLGLGHRSLAFLGCAGEGAWRSAAILLGARVALKASSEGSLPSQRARAGTAPEIRSALNEWLTAASPPTALVCADDMLAVAALQECAFLGIAVPGRLSIVGCGDLPFARHSSPALSTLRIPGAFVGCAAVDQLAERRAGRSSVGPTVPVKLVIRQSTGPAPT